MRLVPDVCLQVLLPAPDTQAGTVVVAAAVAKTLHGDGRPERGAAEFDAIPAGELDCQGAGAKPAGILMEVDLEIGVNHRELGTAVAPLQVTGHVCVSVAVTAEVDVAGGGGRREEK